MEIYNATRFTSVKKKIQSMQHICDLWGEFKGPNTTWEKVLRTTHSFRLNHPSPYYLPVGVKNRISPDTHAQKKWKNLPDPSL